MLFYSYPDYSGNALALYEYVCKNTKYETIWAIKEKDTANMLQEKGIRCFWILDRKNGEKWFYTAKYIFSTHEFDNYYTKRKDQIYIALGHSLVLGWDQFGNINWEKDALKYGKWKSTMADIHFVNSDLTRLLDAGSFYYDARKAIISGEPRCDLLFKKDQKNYLNKIYPGIFKKYKYFIIYIPSAKRSFGFSIGEGFKNNIFNFNNFNSQKFGAFLNKNKICIFYKFHPNDESNGIELKLNIPPHCYSLNSGILVQNALSLYHLLNVFDAMIGDVSSITFEYLLLNKPVIRIFGDISQLINAYNPGLGNIDFWFPGDQVTTQKELEKAISSALKEPKKGSKERIAVRDLLFEYKDGKACERVIKAVENYKPIENIEYEMYTKEPFQKLSEKEKIIINKEEIINNKESIIKKHEKKIGLLNNNLIRKKEHVEQLILSERELKSELGNKMGHIEQLLVSERKLNNDISEITSSKGWKFVTKVRDIKNKLIPPYSKRKFFVKLFHAIIRHPILTMSKMTPKRIGNFFHVLRMEGTSGADVRLNNHMSDNVIPDYKQNINITENINKYEKITDCKHLTFNDENAPLVSIIIPVYNQFNYTYNCLKSILENTGSKIKYEIIIADDCSDDLTKDIKTAVSNINVVITPENYGFLKNCNYAAKQAKGKYILFLNNDTQVQENWLLPLTELIEKDEKIGAVGSKLIYANGMLQEAGGIFWNDASAWNYGRMGDPALPEYNYVKEVDYISGAALMVKKEIWDKLNGFDEHFAPAYCEDSDLCFAVRKMGYKVMYQSASVVVHFEGITNGTEITEGQKQYQIVNQNKFNKKWNKALQKENFPNGKDVFHARDRSRNKKTLLMIDHYVPQYDKDAGSRTIYQYLKLFTNAGFNVKFIGDNFFKHEPYTSILEQMGIEVLYGLYYSQNWKRWLETNGKYIDYVFLNRPHIAVNYIDEVKKYTKAKVFYYGHDLHFLREQREYELKKDDNILKNAQSIKKNEFELLSKSDVSYYPSQVEVDEIKKHNPSIKVKAIPAYIFEKQEKKERDIEKTKNIMFVGGFTHAPNVDGVLWYVNEIYPVLEKEFPNLKTYIIGSNPPESIQKIKKRNIIITGFITDSQLNDYYANCRLSVVPLRYGAGIKGKVIEAMYNQIPVVTTSVGAEGITGAENCLFIKDDPIEFANEIIRIYNNKDLLLNNSCKGVDLINRYFTDESAFKVLREDFKI